MIFFSVPQFSRPSVFGSGLPRNQRQRMREELEGREGGSLSFSRLMNLGPQLPPFPFLLPTGREQGSVGLGQEQGRKDRGGRRKKERDFGSGRRERKDGEGGGRLFFFFSPSSGFLPPIPLEVELRWKPQNGTNQPPSSTFLFTLAPSRDEIGFLPVVCEEDGGAKRRRVRRGRSSIFPEGSLPSLPYLSSTTFHSNILVAEQSTSANVVVVVVRTGSHRFRLDMGGERKEAPGKKTIPRATNNLCREGKEMNFPIHIPARWDGAGLSKSPGQTPFLSPSSF